jgi:hypothetical protein
MEGFTRPAPSGFFTALSKRGHRWSILPVVGFRLGIAPGFRKTVDSKPALRQRFTQEEADRWRVSNDRLQDSAKWVQFIDAGVGQRRLMEGMSHFR